MTAVGGRIAGSMRRVQVDVLIQQILMKPLLGPRREGGREHAVRFLLTRSSESTGRGRRGGRWIDGMWQASDGANQLHWELSQGCTTQETSPWPLRLNGNARWPSPIFSPALTWHSRSHLLCHYSQHPIRLLETSTQMKALGERTACHSRSSMDVQHLQHSAALDSASRISPQELFRDSNLCGMEVGLRFWFQASPVWRVSVSSHLFGTALEGDCRRLGQSSSRHLPPSAPRPLFPGHHCGTAS